ncbi:hypothetical protein [Microcoleus sp. B4-D4]|uniref:hypothetical protein n=1 Tax=Microcoleus sp. B4-D4 TaxID=2818667 RepID=UPI002FCE95EE
MDVSPQQAGLAFHTYPSGISHFCKKHFFIERAIVLASGDDRTIVKCQTPDAPDPFLFW